MRRTNTRRIRRSIFFALALLLIAPAAAAHPKTKSTHTKAKAAYLKAKSPHSKAKAAHLKPERVPFQATAPGDGRITLYRPDKGERETFVYRDKNGRFNEDVLEKINYFFRCRLTGEVHSIDPELIAKLDSIEDHFGGEIKLLSGFRSPERNALMRRHSRGVSKHSLHMKGMAADIEIAGINAILIRNYAYALGRGGVGFYGAGSFVHVDTGEQRTWGWRPTPISRNAAAAK